LGETIGPTEAVEAGVVARPTRRSDFVAMRGESRLRGVGAEPRRADLEGRGG
jgi:hypothetical protein